MLFAFLVPLLDPSAHEEVRSSLVDFAPYLQLLFQDDLYFDGTAVNHPTIHSIHSARLARDRKSTRLNSSHVAISYAVFCLKKKKTADSRRPALPTPPVEHT